MNFQITKQLSKKILLVYPETPATFWSFRNAVKFVSKQSSEPPLGLLTVAALLPLHWQKKLVDTNVNTLKDEDILWADYLFLTGMHVHQASMQEIIQRAKALNCKIVAGGPLCTADYHQFPEVDHFILNEAEITLPQFLEDLYAGREKRIYQSDQFPDISGVPVPQWQLLDMDKYATMSVQYSRGCPFDCEFCNVTVLNGHTPRTKDTIQFLAELDSLYAANWRGVVFIVDDNFIGNRKKLKQDLLPAMIQWSQDHQYPFSYITEASVNLADDLELMQLMTHAGFDAVFIGIETPNSESLAECGKKQNSNRDLLSAVKRMQQNGLIVSGGFIVGFDHDTPGIFGQQIKFIQNSGITTAMVGLLNAPSGTRLFQRLKEENRLLQIMSGNNMDGTLNFIPKMDARILRNGYRAVVQTIYSPRKYYERTKLFLQEYQPFLNKPFRLPKQDILAVFRSIWIIGIREKGRRFFWKLMFHCIVKYPKKFPVAIRLAIYGFHFRKVAASI